MAITDWWNVRHGFSLINEFWVLSFEVIYSILHVASEMSDETLDWPSSGVTQSADSMSFDLVRNLFKHVDLSEIGIAQLHSLEHVDHPGGTLSAWSALAATLVLVEFGESEDGIDDVGGIIHDDDCSGTKTTSQVLEIVEVHQGALALLFGEHWN